jgi:hypothetical protein
MNGMLDYSSDEILREEREDSFFSARTPKLEYHENTIRVRNLQLPDLLKRTDDAHHLAIAVQESDVETEDSVVTEEMKAVKVVFEFLSRSPALSLDNTSKIRLLRLIIGCRDHPTLTDMCSYLNIGFRRVKEVDLKDFYKSHVFLYPRLQALEKEVGYLLKDPLKHHASLFHKVVERSRDLKSRFEQVQEAIMIEEFHAISRSLNMNSGSGRRLAIILMNRIISSVDPLCALTIALAPIKDCHTDDEAVFLLYGSLKEYLSNMVANLYGVIVNDKIMIPNHDLEMELKKILTKLYSIFTGFELLKMSDYSRFKAVDDPELGFLETNRTIEREWTIPNIDEDILSIFKAADFIGVYLAKSGVDSDRIKAFVNMLPMLILSPNQIPFDFAIALHDMESVYEILDALLVYLPTIIPRLQGRVTTYISCCERARDLDQLPDSLQNIIKMINLYRSKVVTQSLDLEAKLEMLLSSYMTVFFSLDPTVADDLVRTGIDDADPMYKSFIKAWPFSKYISTFVLGE